MAPKKTPAAPAPATTNAAPDPLAALKTKIAALPKGAQDLILKNAAGTKLTKAEVGQLRTWKLTKAGDPVKKHDGPRNKSLVNDQAVQNVLDVAGVDGLTKLFTKYGEGLHKPLRKVIKAMADGADKIALETLARAWFPRKTGPGGFASRGYQTIGKVGRVAFDMSKIGGVIGDQVKHETITLADGRVGLFVYVSTKASTAQQAPASASAAASAVPSFMQAAQSA